MKATDTRIELNEVAAQTSVDIHLILRWIEAEWIVPCSPERSHFDSEDVARVRLIQNLRLQFGANDEAIPIILHLLDQVICLRQRLEQEE